MGSVAFNPTNAEDWDGGDCAFTSALYSLITSEAQTYDRENDERYLILTNDSIKDVEFEPFTVFPKLLFYGDLTQDRDYMWSNKPMREYFDKNYVVVIWVRS